MKDMDLAINTEPGKNGEKKNKSKGYKERKIKTVSNIQKPF